MASKPSPKKKPAAAKKPAAKRAPGKPAANNQLRGSSTVEERRVHTPEVARSTRAPATTLTGTLTGKVAKFVEEYVKDFNGRQAAIRAGYSAKTADQQASRLLRSVKVKQALAPIQQLRVAEHAEAINRMELTVERTRLEIARLAYFDSRKMFRPNGEPIPITELDDDTAACIVGLDVLEEYEGSGEDRRLVGHVKKYKIADKNSALDKASKILGLYEKDNDQQARPLAESLGQFLGQLHSTGAAKLQTVAPAKRPANGSGPLYERE